MKHTMVQHDERSGNIGPLYTLTETTLRRQSKGVVGSGIDESFPVASIDGFYAVAYDIKSLTGVVKSQPDQFLFSWRTPDGKRRTEVWMVAVRTASFQQFLAELARLRPEADLRKLPINEAHKRLGKTSLTKVAVLTVAAVLVLSCLGIPAVIALVAALGK